MVRPDPMVLLVAEVVANGDVRIDGRLPAQATVRVGQPLHVNVTFRVREKGGQKEVYRFRLESSVGTQRPRPQEKTWKDMPMKPDDGSGFIGHRFVFDRPGIFEGEVRVSAEYGEGRWFGRIATVQQVEARGKVRVQVV